ncbi:MAG: DUF5011 domain-containing protein, partial [Nitrosopumilus sp.]|nr:DUF5011 domain-containing protein [Nitrosopumilus sp.]
AALLSKTQNTVGLTVTYDCTDEAGNGAVQSVRTFPILDTTNPAPPTVTDRTITVETGESINYGASCAQDAGTPIQLVNSTVDSDSNPVHVIDTRSAGTYEITYKCRDGANLESTTAAQTVTVEERTTTPAAKPVLALGTASVHLMPGQTYVPELTCTLDGSPVNSDISSSDTGISDLADGVQTVTAPAEGAPVEITYTCTSGGQTADETPVLTIISDGTKPSITIEGDNPHHLMPMAGRTYDSVDAGTTCTDAAPGVKAGESSNATEASLDADAELTVAYHCWDLAGNNATAYRQVIVDGTRPVITPVNATIHLELGSIHTDTEPACTDPFPPTDLTGRINTEDGGLAAALSGSANDTVRITHSCVDEAGNPAKQSIRTFEIRDTMSPTISFSHAILEVAFGGTYAEPVATCNDPPRGTFTTTNDGQTVDTDTAGTYTESYTCDDGLTQAATETRTVTVLAAGAGSNPVIGNVPTEPILFREGTTPPAHGLTCDDGGVDLTSRITTLTPVDSTATNGTLDVEYTCTDDDSTTARVT